MKIIELRASNVKRLSAVQINPTSSTVVVGGKNGQGKSSVLDSILYALGGASSLPGRPVRTGEEQAEILVTLDSEPRLSIRRRIRDDGKTDLEIKQVSADGIAATIKSPQTLLDGLCGTIAFDPLAFTRLRPNDQVNVLRQLVGVDTSDLDRDLAALQVERADVHRDARRLAAQVEELPSFADVPAEEQSAEEIVARLEALQKANQQVAQRTTDEAAAQQAALEARHAVAQTEKHLQELEAETRRVREQLKALIAKADAQTEAANALGVELAAMKIEDDRPIRDELAALGEVNAKIRANAQRAALAAQRDAASDQAADLSTQIEALRRQRRERIDAAAWPVEGLGFTDEGVTVNGLPFDQCSSAEQLYTSAAIGLAQHPRLRVLLIRDGSLLDDEALERVRELAAKHDAQIWIERVGYGDECSVIIEDGEVAGRPGPVEQLAETSFTN